jgi:hypothetical protein
VNDRGETSIAERQVHALIADGAHALLATHTAVRATAQAVAADRAGLVYVTNVVDAPGLPGSRMTWVHGVTTSASDLESRAYDTARAALALIGRAGTPERHALRDEIAAAGSPR